MGRLGISFSNENGRPFRIDRKYHYATVVRDEPKPGDGPTERLVAWISYFAMVFVSLCVFSGPALAAVFAQVIGVAPAMDWSLRGAVNAVPFAE